MSLRRPGIPLMPERCPTPSTLHAKWPRQIAVSLWAALAGTHAAWGTSAEAHGPVELAIGAQGVANTPLCAHVNAGSPNEAQQGWSVQLWAGVEPEASATPLWQQAIEEGANASRTWPDAPAQCVGIPTPLLKAGQPYTLEISSIRLYRSRFCWQEGDATRPAQLLAVDSTTQRCTSRPWLDEEEGHALDTGTATGSGTWWERLRDWWRSQPLGW